MSNQLEDKDFIPIKVGFDISYSVSHPICGRAEFTFCPIIKDGIIKQVYIQARSQERDIEAWRLDLPEGDWDEIIFEPTTGVKSSIMWRTKWCDMHKVMMYECYVPDNTNVLSTRLSLGNNISFRFHKED